EHHRRGQRRVRTRADGRRRRARDRHVRRRTAQLLRPQAGRVRRGIRRRVAAYAGVRRQSFVILAIDQGTTGTTCLVVDEDLNVLRRGYAELPQHFPRPGWVEHDPEEIWQSVLAAAGAAGLEGVDTVAITNQRETT